MERIDKVLGNMGYGTRKEIKAFIKNKFVTVDGEVIKDSSFKVDPENCDIVIDGEKVNYRKFIYLLMNKPDGVISATFDNYDKTVIDLLDAEYQVYKPFSVGRLDKDTVGLLIITNDGVLNHKLISPKYHVDKVYYAHIDKEVNEKDIDEFKEGIILDDGYKCLPAKLDIIEAGEEGSKVYVTIHEGKFHQVKRMFESLGKKVIYLKRVKFGKIQLDESLNEGEYRELTESEIELLNNL